MSDSDEVIIDPRDGIDARELSEAGRILRLGVRLPHVPMGAGYEPFWWRGRVAWLCLRCGFTTTRGEAAIRRHVALIHREKE